jgi:hypothetical protein
MFDCVQVYALEEMGRKEGRGPGTAQERRPLSLSLPMIYSSTNIK